MHIQQPRLSYPLKQAGVRASDVSKRSNLHAAVASSFNKHPQETRLQDLLSPFIKPIPHQTWPHQEHSRSRLDLPRHNLTYMSRLTCFFCIVRRHRRWCCWQGIAYLEPRQVLQMANTISRRVSSSPIPPMPFPASTSLLCKCER
jgi:hypothetical protein